MPPLKSDSDTIPDLSSVLLYAPKDAMRCLEAGRLANVVGGCETQFIPKLKQIGHHAKLLLGQGVAPGEIYLVGKPERGVSPIQDAAGPRAHHDHCVGRQE